jgi:hypothetical protein
VRDLLNEVFNFGNVSQSVQDQLYYGLQGRARTCAGFVGYLLSQANEALSSAVLDDAILEVYEGFITNLVVKRVAKDITVLRERKSMTTADVGLLWCHTMLPVIRPEESYSDRLNCIAFTKSVTAVDSSSSSSSSSSRFVIILTLYVDKIVLLQNCDSQRR